MILSMTGYGKALSQYQGKKVVIEIKSLNSKALDLSMRIAPVFREKEIEIRNMISQRLERGKVECYMWIEQTDAATDLPINANLLGAYYQQIQQLIQQCNIPEPTDWFASLMRLPDVVSRTPEVHEITQEEWDEVKLGVQEAIDQLMLFRQQEGEALQKKFEEKLDNISSLMLQIEPYEKERTPKIRQRLIDALQSIPEVTYDQGRLEQEMIYYIEKLDISEEKQRLTNHLAYFRETMAQQPGQGKKLGFIAQEMGREINTTGSKSNQAEMQNIVVMMKDELEQIKEQVLNVM